MAEISKMLVLSTAHLSEFTCNTVLPSWSGPAYEKSEYGWFVYVTEDDDDTPDDLDECCNYARSLDCEWIMFDRDGDVVDGLTTYDWGA